MENIIYTTRYSEMEGEVRAVCFSRCRLLRPDPEEDRALRLPFLLREWLSFEMLSQIFWMSLGRMTMVSQMQVHAWCTVQESCTLDTCIYGGQNHNFEVNLQLLMQARQVTHDCIGN